MLPNRTHNSKQDLPKLESLPISLGNVPVILVSKNQNVTSVEGDVEESECQNDISSFSRRFGKRIKEVICQPNNEPTTYGTYLSSISFRYRMVLSLQYHCSNLNEDVANLVLIHQYP